MCTLLSGSLAISATQSPCVSRAPGTRFCFLRGASEGLVGPSAAMGQTAL